MVISDTHSQDYTYKINKHNLDSKFDYITGLPQENTLLWFPKESNNLALYLEMLS